MSRGVMMKPLMGSPLDNSVLPSFPVDALPKVLGEYVNDVAESCQVPADLPACLILSVISAAMAKSYKVQAGPDWQEPCNLFVVVAMPPASRKSAVFSAITKPIKDVEKTLKEEIFPLQQENAQQRRILERRIKKLEKQAADDSSADELPGLFSELKSLREQLPKEVKQPRVLVDDVTPEELASQLAAQLGRMALMSAEGGIMDIIAGRYSGNIPNMDVFLKGHAGDDLTVDRKGRPPEAVDGPALTIGLAIQPDVLKGMAGKRALHGRGLIARFLYSLPDSNVGHRKINPKPVNPRNRVNYKNVVLELFQPWRAQTQNQSVTSKIISLSTDASCLFNSYREEIELSLRKEGELHGIPDWGGKLPGAVVRIAALLHAALHPSSPDSIPISQETMLNAIKIGGYFQAHAIAAYDLMEVSASRKGAKRLCEWFQSQNSERFVMRAVHQALRGSFPSMNDFMPALEHLINLGLVELQAAPAKSGRGRNPSPIILLTDKFYAQNTQN